MNHVVFLFVLTVASVSGQGNAAGESVALATSSSRTLPKTCWIDGEEHRARPHATDPRKYLCGEEVEWFKSTHETRRYVRRCGKWYRNRRSNSYYRDGKWTLESVKPHPTNPTLYRRACAWIEKPRSPAVRAYFMSPKSGIWYRRKDSHEYVWNNKNFHFILRSAHHQQKQKTNTKKQKTNTKLDAGTTLPERGAILRLSASMLQTPI